MCKIDSSLVFEVLDSGQGLEFTPTVLSQFMAHRQLKSNACEGGGVLSATIEPHVVRIEKISLPTARDNRTRLSYQMCPARKTQFVEDSFNLGLHYVGEWHTHPESDPSPSHLDLEAMSEAFRNSTHQLNYFVMVIVGNSVSGLDLSVTVHNQRDHFNLRPSKIRH